MSENITSEIVPTDVVNGGDGLRAEVVSLSKNEVPVWSSVAGTDFASRVKVINAMTSAEPLADNLNKPFKLANVVVQAIDIADENSGAISTVPRVTLITDDGKAYAAVSEGIYRSVQNILAIVGHPAEWPAALPVKAVKGGKGTRQFFTLEIG